HNRLLLGQGAGQRFFAINVLAVLGGFDGGESVPVVRQGQHYGINVAPGHDLTVVVVAFAVGVFIGTIDGGDGLFQIAFINVAGGQHAAVGLGQEFVGVTGSHHAPADHGHGDLVGGGVLAQNPGRDDGGKGQGTGGLGQKPATGGIR